MRYHVLGPIAVHSSGADLPLGGPKPRTVLAALLLNAGRVVSEDRLIAMAWGDEPPPTVRGQMQTLVSGLRKLLGAGVVVRRPPGYVLRIRPGELDLDEVEAAIEAARREAGRQPQAVAARLRAALALWSGPVLGGVTEALSAEEGPRLRDLRPAVLEELFEAELAAGRHADVIGELLVAGPEYPFRERLQAQAMLALHRCGRTAEALDVFSSVRRRLAEDLGIEPGPELHRTQRLILGGDDDRVRTPAVSPAVPRQLPPDLPGFVGRVTEIAVLDRLLGGTPETAGRVVTIVGTAGVGKTSLAVRWAHGAAARFPDGHLYADLRGFDPTGSALDPADALRGFLDALHLPSDRIPAGLDARASLLRGLLADKRMLLLLDNARDAEQVRPLLPGTPGCPVLVTSRADLTGLLTAHGAQPLTLDLLTGDEARDLLAYRLGADRLHREPEAVHDIVTGAARLPLALAIVAARAAKHPSFALSAIAKELTEFDVFDGGTPGSDVRAAFAASYRTLGPDAAAVFRLLGLHPGPDVTAAATASLVGLPPRVARRALAELARAHLVAEHRPGRYASHDLLRGYAAELAGEYHDDTERRAAQHRMHDHYLHTAWTADRLLIPQRDPIEPAPPRPGVTPEPLPDQDAALAWFRAEKPVLVELIRRMPAGSDTHAWQLAWSLATFLDRQGHWADFVTSHQVALDAARRLADGVALGHTHRNLARAYVRLGRREEARDHLERALDCFRTEGDRIGEAHVRGNLSWLLEQQSRPADALVHAQQALRLYRIAGDKAMQANALNTVGWLHALLGEYAAAQEHCEQALALLQPLRDRFGEAVTWDSLGYVHQHQGDLVRATAAYRRAVEIFREVGDRPYEAGTLDRLGDAHRAAGEPEAARQAWRQALAIFDDIDHPGADGVRAKLPPAAAG